MKMKQSTDLTLEVRSTDGTAAGFYESDAERVTKALRQLATPRLFAEPQLTLASEHAVTAIATRTISPPETDGAAPATGIPDASRRRGEARPSCLICQAEIVDNHWFCRLPQNGNGNGDSENLTILFCSPRCALCHFATLRPGDNGFASDYEQHEPIVHFLIDGE
jgi:hypothetical protein